MIELIEAHNWSELLVAIEIRAIIILVCWTFMVISCLVDFCSGTSTAKAIGEPLMSHGFRRTISKIGAYAMVMVFFLMFDILGGLLPFYILPFSSMLCAAGIMLIEGKSVIENSQKKKANAGNLPDAIKEILKASTTKQAKDILNKINSKEL